MLGLPALRHLRHGQGVGQPLLEELMSDCIRRILPLTAGGRYDHQRPGARIANGVRHSGLYPYDHGARALEHLLTADSVGRFPGQPPVIAGQHHERLTVARVGVVPPSSTDNDRSNVRLPHGAKELEGLGREGVTLSPRVRMRNEALPGEGRGTRVAVHADLHTVL